MSHRGIFLGGTDVKEQEKEKIKEKGDRQKELED